MGNDPEASAAHWIRCEADSLRDSAETRSLVWAGARLSTNYLVMNAAATLIAGYGLLANSEAVIIGAMLIAMLYGPILGIGLALAELDASLLYRSIVAEAIGAAWVFLIGYGLGWVHGNVPVTDEMLARTAPNILDLMIAFVGGAAGAYATASPRISSAVVGVAIATALCPPLAACGILLSHGFTQLAAGAVLLFFTNLVAIAAAAMAIFLMLGHKSVRVDGGLGRTLAARTVPLVVLVVLGGYLLDAFHESIEDSSLRAAIQRVLEDDMTSTPGARVVEIRLTKDQGHSIAWALIRSPVRLTSEVVARLDDKVDRATGRDVLLHVRTVQVEELTREGPVSTPRALSARERM